MQKVTLTATTRTETGKGVARSLRRDGKIPGVIYRKGQSEALTLNHREMRNFINKTRGEKALITLDFGGSSKMALMKEYQVDPVDNILLHADFMEIDMNEKVKVPIKLKFIGEAIGVKRDKGVLEPIMREVEVEALPAQIPGHIDVDITQLAAGFTLHVSDLQIPEGVSIVTDPKESVVSVSIPKLASEYAPGEGAAEGAEKAEAKEEAKEE